MNFESNLEKVIFEAIFDPLIGPNEGQILFFTWSSQSLQRRNLSWFYDQLENQIFKKLPFRPHLVPPRVASWDQLGPNLIFCLINTITTVKATFLKLWTVGKSDFQKFAFGPSLTLSVRGGLQDPLIVNLAPFFRGWEIFSNCWWVFNWKPLTLLVPCLFLCLCTRGG